MCVTIIKRRLLSCQTFFATLSQCSAPVSAGFHAVKPNGKRIKKAHKRDEAAVYYAQGLYFALDRFVYGLRPKPLTISTQYDN